MKKRIIAILGVIVLICGIALTACSKGAQETPTEATKAPQEKILVAYFSATGNTKAVALQISENTNADLFEIVPKEPYTEVQLGYDDPEQRVTKEQSDEKCRVEIQGKIEAFEQYKTIYIGYPIWYGKAPRIILTFLESYNFEGKTVIPFCTSDNDGIEAGLDEIKAAAPKAEWLEGMRFDGGKLKAAVDENGTVTDEAVKKEIKSFSDKVTVRVNESGDETAGAASKEESGKTEASNESTASTTKKNDKTTSTTKQNTTVQTTKQTTENKTEKPTETTTQAPTETTTLGEHDTPFIPIP